MRIRLLRHATLVVDFGGRRLLVDPMLSPAGAMDPIQNASNSRRIPMVDLPLDDDEVHQLMDSIDGVLVTHTHRDHWDPQAVTLLAHSLPILCQPASALDIRGAGFGDVTPIDEALHWQGIEVERTDGRHGTGEIGARMGTVSGFVLSAPGEPGLYIAGDTIWCDEVATIIDSRRPDVVVVNAGAAQFLSGDPITMTSEDVEKVSRTLPGGQVVAIHMEAINHCLLTRAALSAHLDAAGVRAHVHIPADGATLEFGAT